MGWKEPVGGGGGGAGGGGGGGGAFFEQPATSTTPTTSAAVRSGENLRSRFIMVGDLGSLLDTPHEPRERLPGRQLMELDPGGGVLTDPPLAAVRPPDRARQLPHQPVPDRVGG